MNKAITKRASGSNPATITHTQYTMLFTTMRDLAGAVGGRSAPQYGAAMLRNVARTLTGLASQLELTTDYERQTGEQVLPVAAEALPLHLTPQ